MLNLKLSLFRGGGSGDARPGFYESSQFGLLDVMSSATTAAQSEYEAPTFPVVESKGLRSAFTVFASTDIEESGLASFVQAHTLLS